MTGSSEEQGGDRQLKYKTYLDERRSLVNTELDVSSRFDKSILTLSGGALLLSMTFVKDIASKPNLACALLTAWLLLALTICLMLISLLTSQSALRRQRDILDDDLGQPEPEVAHRNLCGVVTHWLNVSSIAVFITALVFLSVFIAANLPGR